MNTRIGLVSITTNAYPYEHPIKRYGTYVQILETSGQYEGVYCYHSLIAHDEATFDASWEGWKAAHMWAVTQVQQDACLQSALQSTYA